MEHRLTEGLYQPLNTSRQEIRLLHIRKLRPLQCSFEHVCLDVEEVAAFTTISWVWGDITVQQTLSIDGQILSIPDSAFIVLNEMCIAQQKYVIWMDVICINQQDTRERSQQVGLMSLIYTKSQSTMIWLGLDDGSAMAAVQTMNYILDWRRSRQTVDGGSLCGRWCNEKARDPFPALLDWESMMKFFSSTWFRRFWIIQEVIFSKTAILFKGRTSIDWQSLAMVAHYLVVQDFDTDLSEGMNGVLNAHFINEVGRRNRVDQLLAQSWRFGATDPRDRAFALYGLITRSIDVKTEENQQFLAAFKPQYDKSLRQVYTGMTRAVFQHRPDQITLLLSCNRLVPRQPCSDHDVMQSWIPRYDYIQNPSNGSYPTVEYSYNRGHKQDKYNAVFDFNTSNEVLRISGIVVDKIIETIEPVSASLLDEYTSTTTYEALYDVLSKLWQSIKRNRSRSSDSELSQMLKVILSVGHVALDASGKIDPHWTRDFCAFVHHFWPDPKPPYEQDVSLTSTTMLDSWTSNDSLHNDSHEHVERESSEADEDAQSDDDSSNAESSHDSSSLSAHSDSVSRTASSEAASLTRVGSRLGSNAADLINAKSFRRRVCEYTVNRPFFISEQGKLGSAARSACAGDAICIIPGLPVPMILRPFRQQYILIGDAFLYGVSVDEHLSDIESEDRLRVEQQWFDVI